MKKMLMGALLAMSFSPAVLAETPKAPLPHFTPDLAHSQLRFVAMQNGAPVEGAFKNYSGDIFFDPDRLKESGAKISVDVTSAFTAYPEVAKTLQNAEWFDAAKFPSATFEVLEMFEVPAADGGHSGQFYANGELTLKGVTQPVTVNFRMLKYTAQEAIAEGRATLTRSEYHVGAGEWAKTDSVEDAVAVTFRLTAKRAQ